MQIGPILIVAAVVFGICFCFDKLFTALFRSKQQHTSGLSVRCSKRYGSAGLIVAILGLAAMLMGGTLMLVCGTLLILSGIVLVVYYLTFGIFYDDEAFVYNRFGKRSKTYSYKDINSQQLYRSYSNIVIELHMTDGSVVQIQSGMDGVYPFLDKAFSRWLELTDRKIEDCQFYDPQNSCWFPPVEG